MISTVTGNIFASDIDTELNLKNLTGSADISGIITGNTFAPAAQPMWIETGAGADTLQATSGADTFVTYKEGGADTAIDKVIYSDTITSLTKITGGWEVTSSGNTNIDTLKGVDVIDDAGAGRILLVGTGGTAGSGGFATINAAIAAADPGDTIRIAAGTYTETVVVNKANLTLIGDGDATIIQGTGINGSIGVNIQASGAALQDIKVAGFHYDVRVTGDVSDIVIDDVTLADAKVGFGKSTTSDITGLTVKDSTFTDLVIGVDLPTASSEGRVTNLEFLDNTFTDITHKGFYAEALSNALLEGVTMTQVGQEGNDSGLNGNGIDINLKYDAYSDITIKDFTFVDVGGDDANGAAIAVKARNDGATYGADPASFTGEVLIEGGSISGATVGIRAGEAGQTVAHPAVKIVDVTINSSVADIDNRTTSTMTTETDTPLSVAITSTGYIDDGVADVLTVGAGGTYSTITAALAAAHEGDTIKIAAGTYTENVVVNVANLTIEGADGVVIDGAGTGNGITISADGVTLENLTVQEFVNAVRLQGGATNATLEDLNLIGTGLSGAAANSAGIDKEAGADVSGLRVDGVDFSGLRHGVVLAAAAGASDASTADDVQITNSTFTDITWKGIYAEALSNARITGITMTNVGNYGGSAGSGNEGKHGNAIDINLKYADYTDVLISDFTFTNVGRSLGSSETPHLNGGAISIKLRTDGTTYGADPASFAGSVVIRDGSISGTSTGIRVGEYKDDLSVPAGTGINLEIEDVAITGETTTGGHGDFVNKTTATITVSYVGVQPSYSLGSGSNLIIFDNNTPAPEPEPEEEEPAPPPPPPPPPPNPGQGPGAQLPDAIVESFDNVTGVDPTSEKASQPTIVLPSGEEIPNPIYEEVLVMADLVAQLQAGLISEETVIDKMVEFATDTTAVALQAYQFFTGATPTQEGVTYLVNSDDNENDLTDPYYATFSPDNRYINFAVSLGTGGEGAANFEAEYGQLSFEDAVKSAYDTIIGLDEAEAAGINVTEAIAYVMAQLAYFTALGGSAIGAKAAMVGFLMFAGMNAKVGVYYDGTRGFLADAFNGEADYNVDLTGGAGSGGFTSSGLELGLA